VGPADRSRSRPIGLAAIGASMGSSGSHRGAATINLVAPYPHLPQSLYSGLVAPAGSLPRRFPCEAP
jgi:hypothetical protein